MNIISAHSPRYTEYGTIDLTVDFEEIGKIPFHASPDDPVDHGRELFERAIAGEFGPVAPYTPPVIPIEELRVMKLEAIQAAKNKARDGGFIYEGVLFDSDAGARLAYLELSTKFVQDPTYSTQWKASTGVWVTMTAALFTALQTAYEAHISACFAWQAMKEQELATALATNDLNQVLAISTTYGE